VRRSETQSYYKESLNKSCRKCGEKDDRADRLKCWSGWTYISAGQYKRWLCPNCQNAKAYPESQLESWIQKRER
jgi:rubrerythrin